MTLEDVGSWFSADQLRMSIARERQRRNVATLVADQLRLHVRECAMCRECVAYFLSDPDARLRLCDVGKAILLELFD